MLLCLALLLLLTSSQSNCPTITVKAIVSCQFTFQPTNNSCRFHSCLNDTNAFSQPLHDWTFCYASCCPGMVVPLKMDSRELDSCVEEFSSTPKSFYIIMALTISLTVLICILIPCCLEKNCPLSRLKASCLQSFKQRFCYEETSVQRIIQRSQKPSQPIQADSVTTERKLVSRKERILLVNPRIDHQHSIKECVWCTNFDSDLLLIPCNHCCHKGCVKQEQEEMLCPKCGARGQKMRVYCCQCSIRYDIVERIDLEKDYICSICQI